MAKSQKAAIEQLASSLVARRQGAPSATRKSDWNNKKNKRKKNKRIRKEAKLDFREGVVSAGRQEYGNTKEGMASQKQLYKTMLKKWRTDKQFRKDHIRKYKQEQRK
jgi:hypothetical protein